jgi:uncharacterized small protein (DUF1192 family)
VPDQRELGHHIGHEPSVTERILIERIAALQWELLKLDARVEDEGLDSRAWTLLTRPAERWYGLRAPMQPKLRASEPCAVSIIAGRIVWRTRLPGAA